MLLFFLFGGVLQVGCQISVQNEQIRDIQITLTRSEEDKTPIPLANGLIPEQSYFFQIAVETASGNRITNPKTEDIIIESPNGSTSGLKVGKSGRWFITIANGFQVRHDQLQFRIRVKDNPYEGKLFKAPVYWEGYNKIVHQANDGSLGRDGEIGRNGDPGVPEEEKTHGQDGEVGQDGEAGGVGEPGPNLSIYVAKYEEVQGDQTIQGRVFKVIVAGQAPFLFFTKAKSVYFTTAGGNGGSGGTGGMGGKGGDGSPEHPDYAPGRGGHGGDGGAGGAGGYGGNGGDVQFFHLGNANVDVIIECPPGKGGLGGVGGVGGEGGGSLLKDGVGGTGYAGSQGQQGTDGYAGNILPSPMSQSLIAQQFEELRIKPEMLKE